MFKSIFSRLFWTYATILIFVFILVSVATSLFVDNYTVKKQTETVISVSDTLEYWTGTYQIEQNNIRADMAYKQMLKSWAEFIGSDIIVASLDNKIQGATKNINSVPENYMDGIKEGKTIVKKGTFGGEYKDRQLTVGMPVRYNGTIIAAMFFNTPLKTLTRTTFDIVTIFLVCAAISFFLAFVFIYIQSKRISSPIGKINRAVQQIAAGNFSGRVKITSNDEIGQLASSFNFMADSVEDLENMRAGFISDVSHELRTPMTSISGFAQSMIDGKISEESQKEYLKIIVDESKRLTKLVNDMLEMTKMSSSEYQLTIDKFDLNELVRICIISMENAITNKNLDLNVKMSDEALNVLADKDSITRVILNLMDNAIKFSYENTVIGIEVGVRNKKAYITVGNFGDGIDKKDLSNIFNRFYKTDKSRERVKSGAGLGLSLCKNILNLHKQSIWVESDTVKEGSKTKYTKFTFTLETA